MEEIVKVVEGRNGFKRREFTRKEMNEFEAEYLEEAERIRLKIIGENTRLTDAEYSIVYEKMLEPFVYWLQHKLEAESANQRRGFSKDKI